MFNNDRDEPNVDTPDSRILRDSDGGWRVVWHEQACTPSFNSKGAAEAYRDQIKKGTRQPEYPR